MRPRTAGVASAIIAMLSVPVLAQDRSSCRDTKDYYGAIKGCSEFIRSHPKDAIAYHMRGDALAKNGDLGQAIVDYTKAIELNPTYAAAYDSRAAAFVSKGDYTRAVADVTKAGELASKKGQLAKAKAPLRAKPKISGRASAKAKNEKGAEATTFNPFEDRANPQ